MSEEINRKTVSQTDLSASFNTDSGSVFGCWLRINEGTQEASDWLTNEEARELRDWLNANIPDEEE